MEQDDVPYLKLISLSNALEAFLGTKEENQFNTCENKNEISSQVSRRAALLLSIHDPREDWERRVKKFYDIRSALVHGRIPAFDMNISKQIKWGLKMVQQTLIEGMYWNLYLVNKNLPETIQDIHQCFEKELPQYCKNSFVTN